jgi:hypothetical protein
VNWVVLQPWERIVYILSNYKALLFGQFGYPPKHRVLGVHNARKAGLVHRLFRIFRKNLSLNRGGDPPRGGVPPMGVPPPGGNPKKKKPKKNANGSLEIFFAHRRKKNSIVSLASVSDLSTWPPPWGSTGRGGTPPRAGPPPLIKDRFFRKMRKRRCTKPAIRALWTPKTL